MNDLQPGWYEDPQSAECIRYWDGVQWTATAPRSGGPTTNEPLQASTEVLPPTESDGAVSAQEVPTSGVRVDRSDFLSNALGLFTKGVLSEAEYQVVVERIGSDVAHAETSARTVPDRMSAERLYIGGFLSGDEYEVVLERIEEASPAPSEAPGAPGGAETVYAPPPATPPVALSPTPAKPPAVAPAGSSPAPTATRSSTLSPPRSTPVTPTRRVRPWVPVAVGLGAVATVVILLASRSSALSADVSMTVLGDDCSNSAYADVNQVVVKNPKGEEVAFADLDEADSGPGHCNYTGKIDISDGSDYFVVGSRSQIRSGLRLTRKEIESDGISMTVGECLSDLDVAIDDVDSDVVADCLAFLGGSDGEGS